MPATLLLAVIILYGIGFLSWVFSTSAEGHETIRQ